MSSPRKALAFALMFYSGVVFASEYQPGEVIVKYKDGAFRERSAVTMLYSDLGVSKVRRTGLHRGLEQLVLKSGQSVEDAIALLSLNPTVEYAQPNYILHALPVYDEANKPLVSVRTPCIFPGIPFPPGCGEDSPSTRPELKPAPADVNPPVVDPSLSKAYGLTKVSAQEAWKVHSGSKSFIVADIDTGADYNHEDLAGNMWRNITPSSSNDIVGFDFVHNDGLPFDDNGHGSHTAGTIGAVGGNGIGVSGVSRK